MAEGNRLSGPIFAPDACEHEYTANGYCVDCDTHGLARVPRTRLAALERVAAAARGEGCQDERETCTNALCQALAALDGGPAEAERSQP